MRLLPSYIIFLIISAIININGSIVFANPISIEADNLVLFRTKEIMHAKGSAMISRDTHTIKADEVIWFKKDHLYHAKGNIIGEIKHKLKFFADEVVFKQDANSGVAKSVAAKIQNRGLLTARALEMHDSHNITAHYAKYTTCNICKENLVSNKPTWQIEADSIHIDLQESNMAYKNASLRFLDTPIFYLPYFKAPLPNAKRRSGFLIPSIKLHSKNLGSTISIPYYFNLAPNADLLYTARLSSSVGVIHEIQHRYLNHNASYELKIHTNYAPRYDAKSKKIPGKHKWIGGYELISDYRFNNNSYLSIDSKMIKDKLKTFNKKYGYGEEQTLPSHFHYRMIKPDLYFGVHSLYFQELRPDFYQQTTPLVLPMLELNKRQEFGSYKVDYDLNMVHLMRSQGAVYKRVSLDALITKSMRYNMHNLEYGWQNGVDFYKINYRPLYINSPHYHLPSNHQNLHHTHIRSTLYTKWQIESSHHFNGQSLWINPVIMPVFSADNHHQQMRGVNEDTQIPEISAINLFELNRFRGYDQREDSLRINYGMQGSLANSWIHNLHFLFGQVYQLKPDRQFDRISGMDKKFSDYVSAIDWQINEKFNVFHQARYSSNNFNMLKNSLGANYHNSYSSYSIIYSSMHPMFFLNKEQAADELQLTANWNLYNDWRLETKTAVRLKDKSSKNQYRIMHYSAIMKYGSECLNIGVGIMGNAIRFRDIKPSVTPILQFEMLNF